MIANGTGIASFLGMIDENNNAKNLYLFWGTAQNSRSMYHWVCRCVSLKIWSKLKCIVIKLKNKLRFYSIK
jgi:hypothetical protein